MQLTHPCTAQVRFEEQPDGQDGEGAAQEPAPWQPAPQPFAAERPGLAVSTAPACNTSSGGGRPADDSAAAAGGQHGDLSDGDGGQGGGAPAYAPPPAPAVAAVINHQPSYLRAHLQVFCPKL